MRIGLILLALVACKKPVSADSDTSSIVDQTDIIDRATRIDGLARPVGAANDIPALAVAVVDSEGLFAVGVDGERVAGGGEPATARDRWHLGSNTKAMTATLAAILVDEGVLSWTMSVGEVWPDAHESWRASTLEDLLRHRSGATPSIGRDHPDIWASMWAAGDTPDALAAATASLRARPLDGAQGAFAYSNAGYMMAGAMIEVRTGSSWQTLMEERLFEPQGMDECGFGPPTGDQPWGHSAADGTPMDPAAGGADNPPALGPAGTVHCSMASWGQFVALHIRGGRGEDDTLSEQAWAHLHTPPAGGDYADGWIVADRPWANGAALAHNGSNTMWMASMWVAPGIDRAFLAVTNTGFGNPAAATDTAIGVLINADLQRQ